MAGASYLLGSIPTSVWVGRFFFGVDIRRLGSGNAGGTNTLRVLGWRAALPVIIVDVGKGVVATLLPRWTGLSEPAWLPLVCAACAVAGHAFPIFASFRGGKGVATAAGGLVTLAPHAALACAAVFFVVVALTRIVSLASVLAAITLPVSVWGLDARGPSLAAPGAAHIPGLVPLAVILAAFVIWAHRSNLGRLWRGEEPRLTIGHGV